MTEVCEHITTRDGRTVHVHATVQDVLLAIYQPEGPDSATVVLTPEEARAVVNVMRAHLHDDEDEER